jgi:hypothetical protein
MIRPVLHRLPPMAARPAPFSPGHEVDLLLASELLGGADPFSPAQDPPGLHVCPDCDRPFVVPGEVHEVIGASRVKLDLACTNCGWSTTAVHDDHELAALDMQLDRSFADLLWTLEVVWTANEDAAIGRFARALDAGAILPEDF